MLRRDSLGYVLQIKISDVKYIYDVFKNKILLTFRYMQCPVSSNTRALESELSDCRDKEGKLGTPSPDILHIYYNNKFIL